MKAPYDLKAMFPDLLKYSYNPAEPTKTSGLYS